MLIFNFIQFIERYIISIVNFLIKLFIYFKIIFHMKKGPMSINRAATIT